MQAKLRIIIGVTHLVFRRSSRIETLSPARSMRRELLYRKPSSYTLATVRKGYLSFRIAIHPALSSGLVTIQRLSKGLNRNWRMPNVGSKQTLSLEFTAESSGVRTICTKLNSQMSW